MDFFNEKLIKAMAFEKAVIEVLKKDNPKIKENFSAYEKADGKTRLHHQYDAVIFNTLNLDCFNMDSIYAERIAIEIKAGSSPREILRRFVLREEDNFDAIVFILATKSQSVLKETVSSKKCKIYFIFKEDLVKNNDIKGVLNNFDRYIAKENNIVIEDNYPLLQKTASNLSFAMGAGCSKNSHISDWNTLSEALGYELLYSIMDTREAKYKTKIITDTLNTSIFSCFDKNSALDAIYNSYMKLSTTGQQDYWLSIKRVLYMNYDSPNDAKQPLVDAIVSCIKRKNIDAVINYNFDSVVELNIDSKYKSTYTEVQSSVTSMIGCNIYHVHGYIPFDYDGKIDVANFIFTDKEYYGNMSNPNSFSNTTQSAILNNKNVIFVGVSFTDSNMKEILRQRVAQGYYNTIFAFIKLPNFDFEGINKKLMENKYKLIQQCYFDSLGVKILWVNNFDEIPKQINLI